MFCITLTFSEIYFLQHIQTQIYSMESSWRITVVSVDLVSDILKTVSLTLHLQGLMR
jgi:hypothetical protein